jgi:hypothetical protein
MKHDPARILFFPGTKGVFKYGKLNKFYIIIGQIYNVCI